MSKIREFLSVDEFLSSSSEFEITKSKYWSQSYNHTAKYHFGKYSKSYPTLAKESAKLDSDLDILLNHAEAQSIIFKGIMARLRIRSDNYENLAMIEMSPKTKNTLKFARSLYTWAQFLLLNPAAANLIIRRYKPLSYNTTYVMLCTVSL